MNTGKKFGIIILSITIAFAIGWMVYSSITTIKHKGKLKEFTQSVPDIIYIDLDSANQSLKTNINNQPLAIIYFNSDCDICIEEAVEIYNHRNDLAEIQLLFISLQNLSSIRLFADSTGLSQMPNVFLGKIDDHVVDHILSIRSTPQVFIYNKAGELTKQFIGQTKIEAIIKYANQE
jgi:hypothetical protein